MDTSRSYVKMCRKAQVLQRSWIPEEKDWWHVGARDAFEQIKKIAGNGIEKWTGGEKYYYIPQDIVLYGIVWLPRADQLKKMSGYICEGKKLNKTINSKISEFCSACEIEENLSEEKMWLIYYMAKNFNKIWVEGRWIKQKNMSNIL